MQIHSFEGYDEGHGVPNIVESAILKVQFRIENIE